MKRLILIVLFATLSGCAMLDAYNMAGFDANEYQLATKVRSKAEISKTDCPDVALTRRNVSSILSVATEFKNYTASIPHNEEATNMSKSLLLEVQGLSDRYKTTTPSVPYCFTKMNIIERSAKTIQTVLGTKPR
jgi:hypothetical protein